jgi:hypothetical protein
MKRGIMAKFISPEQVRNALFIWDNEQAVSLLTKTDIMTILEISTSYRNVTDELNLMAYFGICYEIPMPIGEIESVYLYPSLGDIATMKFTMEKIPSFSFAGVRVTAANNSIFVPGLFCQFIVSLCAELNIYRKEIHNVCINGALLTCPGIMDGQLMAYSEPSGDAQAILFLMMASNPDMDHICEIFEDMIRLRFPQCIGYMEEKMCPKCVEIGFEPIYSAAGYNVEVYDEKSCKNGHSSVDKIPKQENLRHIQFCLSHKILKHDFYISYCVSSEGNGGTSEISCR